MATKEVDEEQQLSDKIAKLTIKVQDQCNNELLADSVVDFETCKTPTAIEHRIPEISTCPPAPKKRKGPFTDADNNDDKRVVKEKEVETLFFPDHDSSN